MEKVTFTFSCFKSGAPEDHRGCAASVSASEAAMPGAARTARRLRTQHPQTGSRRKHTLQTKNNNTHLWIFTLTFSL